MRLQLVRSWSAVGATVLLAASLMALSASGAVGASEPRAAGDSILVSVPTVGGWPNNQSIEPDPSRSGGTVAFSSFATDMVPGDDNGAYDVFVRKTITGTTERVSVSSAEQQANGYSYGPAISANTQVVVFQSNATNLVASAVFAGENVFLRDLGAGTTELISKAPGGGALNGASTKAEVSADGRFVVFQSAATNLSPADTLADPDVYVRDRVAGTTELVSVTMAGAAGGGDSASISADGRYVGFVSGSPGLTPFDENGTSDVFVRDREAEYTRRASEAFDGTASDAASTEAMLSGDGHTIAFVTAATTLDTQDTNGIFDVYAKDLWTGDLERISVADTEEQLGQPSFAPTVNGDGQRISFLTGSADVVAGDTNSASDAFVREPQVGSTVRVSIGSGGVEGNGGVPSNALPVLSPDGSTVVFGSKASNLQMGDVNGTTDVFRHSLVPLAEPRCIDTDGTDGADGDQDALCDNWEDWGIDSNYDGLVDLRLHDENGDGTISPSEQADRDHKDIFVEVDFMEEHRPNAASMQQVIDAFAASDATNPDGTAGIRLHVKIDEQATLHADDIIFEGCTGPPAAADLTFDAVKADSFGTLAERRSALPVDLLAAKRYAFHYALFAHHMKGLTNSGCAELPGNDLLVTLGAYTGPSAEHSGGSTSEVSATFMHELGHNLNLRHGGADNMQCKPNYPSIMNYMFQFDGQTVVGRPLDFARDPYNVLNEAALSEPDGIGFPAGPQSAHWGIDAVTSVISTVIIPTGMPVDWNFDSDAADLIVAQDINASPIPGCGGFGTVLAGQDDWLQLDYAFRYSPDFAPGAHTTPASEPELSFDDAAAASPDGDEDGVNNVGDNCMSVANPTQADADDDGVGDGCEPVCLDGPFPDVPSGSAFCPEIDWMVGAGITGGYGDGTFRPSAPITRQAMAAFLFRLAGEPDVAGYPPAAFNDVAADSPFGPAIRWLSGEGISGGYADGGFHPTAPITRQAMAAFLWRLASAPSGPAPAPGFSDVPPGSSFSEPIAWMADEGVTGGYADGGFHPSAAVSRQAMAAFLERFVRPAA